MAAVRLRLGSVRLCIRQAQLILHGARRDAAGAIVDHVDIVIPWDMRHSLQTVLNLDGDSHA